MDDEDKKVNEAQYNLDIAQEELRKAKEEAKLRIDQKAEADKEEVDSSVDNSEEEE